MIYQRGPKTSLIFYAYYIYYNMIKCIYKPQDLRYVFMQSDSPNQKELTQLEGYLNKIPSFMFLPSFRGIPKPEVFLNKFKSKDGKTIFWCHSGLIGTIYEWCKDNNISISGIDSNFTRREMTMTLEDFKRYVNSWEMTITPRDYQYEAAYKILQNRQSLSQLATRAGKTLIAYMVFRYMLEHGAKKILMVVPSIQLVKQGVEDFSEYKEFFKSETVSHIIDRFGERPDESGNAPLILIDPVMGDDGELYSTYTHELMLGMRRLSRRAHLLTPNLTEACFLTDTPYQSTAKLSEPDALAFANTLLDRLTEVTQGRIVITGIHLSDGSVANVGLDAGGTRFCVKRPHESRSYPGTGDLFASVLLGALLRGDAFPDACAYAAEFTGEVIHESAPIPTPERDGVALEHHLWKLILKKQ